MGHLRLGAPLSRRYADVSRLLGSVLPQGLAEASVGHVDDVDAIGTQRDTLRPWVIVAPKPAPMLSHPTHRHAKMYPPPSIEHIESSSQPSSRASAAACVAPVEELQR